MLQGATPPSLPGWPVVGSLGIFGNTVEYLQNGRRYGDVVALRVFNFDVVLTYSTAAAEHVLVTNQKNYKKDQYIQRAGLVFGNGLLRAEGNVWLRQRRLMQPGFHRQRIRGYADTMSRLSEHFVATLADGAEADFHELMTELTLHITVATMFGQSVETKQRRVGEHMTAIMSRFETLGYMVEPDWWPSPSQLRYQRAIRAVDGLIHEIVAARKSAPGDDVLSMLLETRDEYGAPMSDPQVRDEVMTLFVAGHETTALALVFAWRLLAQHPAIARALHDEVCAAGELSLETLAQLPLLDQVIKETLRLYPPVYGIPREAVGDDVLCGYRVREKTRVVLCVGAMHRDPAVFIDPDAFHPERWTKDFEASLHRYAYFPFGGGPRLCIGAAFADIESKIVLASFIAKFRPHMTPQRPLEVVSSLTQRPRYGLRVKLERWS